jgi:hypothetical protein
MLARMWDGLRMRYIVSQLGLTAKNKEDESWKLITDLAIFSSVLA